MQAYSHAVARKLFQQLADGHWFTGLRPIASQINVVYHQISYTFLSMVKPTNKMHTTKCDKSYKMMCTLHRFNHCRRTVISSISSHKVIRQLLLLYSESPTWYIRAEVNFTHYQKPHLSWVCPPDSCLSGFYPHPLTPRTEWRWSSSHCSAPPADRHSKKQSDAWNFKVS